MHILMTGITSFLGSYTARQLILDGHEVTGLVRPGSRSLDKVRERCPGARICMQDLENMPQQVTSGDLTGFAWAKDGYDACIHFAWDGPGSAARMDAKMQEKNIRFAKNMYRISALAGCRCFVFSGSQAEYGTGTKEAPQPVSEYGKGKLAFGRWAAEQSALHPQMRYVHMRIYSVYGKGDHETSLVNTLIRACVQKDTLALSPCVQKWNYLEVRDCARAAALLAVSEQAEGIYDVAGTSGMPLRDYVDIIGRICNGQGCYTFGTRADNAEGAADLVPDTRRLEALGFRQEISFEEGIRQLYQEMEKQTS